MMVTKHKETRLEDFGVEIQNKQEVSKYITVAQELGKKLDDLKRFTSSPEEFKKALKEEFDGDINQFNQNLIIIALALKYLEKAAEGDEELKKLLQPLQGEMKVINENIEKIAKELGYTVSSYSLDKLMGKDLNGVMETLAKDFGGVKPKLEAIFSPEALNSLTDLFAFMVSKYPISSVNATVATVPIISDNKQKSAEGKFAQQVVLQQQTEQPVFKQPSEEKQNKDYHSPLRGAGKIIAIAGVVLGVLGGALFAGSLFYLPLMGWGLASIGLAVGAEFIVPLGVVVWAAGLMSEAWHKHLVQKAQEEALKQQKKELKQKKAEEEEKDKENEKVLSGQDKNRIEAKEIPKSEPKYTYTQARIIDALNNQHEDIRRGALSPLKEILESKDPNVRREALPILEAAFKNPDEVVRKEALSYLEVALVTTYDAEEIVNFYNTALKSPYDDVRIGAQQMLEKLLGSKSEPK
jgi:hypothetical protein